MCLSLSFIGPIDDSPGATSTQLYYAFSNRSAQKYSAKTLRHWLTLCAQIAKTKLKSGNLSSQRSDLKFWDMFLHISG